MAAYSIRQVDGDEYADEIERLQDATDLAHWKYEQSTHWWLAFLDEHPVAYAAYVEARTNPGTVYLCRAGVLPQCRGAGLQRRLVGVRERHARKHGYVGAVSDTYDNPHSANNLIRCGYRMFTPSHKWAFVESQYWRKAFV